MRPYTLWLTAVLASVALAGAAKASGQQTALPPPASPPPSTIAASPAGAPAPSQATPEAQPPPASSSKVFNPDIAVIGNFLGAAGNNSQVSTPAFQMQEVEVSFRAAVDPYARADFFVAIGQDGSIDLEEGYATFTSLPLGLLAKVGKLRAAFGKVNQMHNHVLPWTDRPLMTDNLLGGEGGLSDAGFSVSRLIPNRALFVEVTAEVYRGESEIFQAPTSSDLTYVGRLRGYRDISDAANIDIGGSVAYGHNGVGPDSTTQLVGFDATFRYRPLRTALYRRFLARTEMAWSRRSELAGQPQSFGAYVSGEYQFSRRWYVGARLDYADRAEDPLLTDKGGSLILTFVPSEFSQIRGQYRRTRYGEGTTANEFLVQFLFSIGAHGAHVF
jgi:hypothetical protein